MRLTDEETKILKELIAKARDDGPMAKACYFFVYHDGELHYHSTPNSMTVEIWADAEGWVAEAVKPLMPLQSTRLGYVYGNDRAACEELARFINNLGRGLPVLWAD